MQFKMDFVTAILTGATVKHTTEEFAYSLMEAVVQNPQNWFAQVSHHFVGQCFRVLGLKFSVSVEAFEQTYDHSYRDDNLTYIFNVVPFVLEGVESFLLQLPTLLAFYEGEVLKDMPKTHLGKQFYDLAQPVRCYLRLVDIWTHVVRSVTDKLQEKDNAIDKFLCEPLVRLSFGILRGLVKLLPDSNYNSTTLKDMCLRLAVLARYGIFFEETFNFILTPMLDMFEEYFELFCERSALLFVFSAFNCKMPTQDGYIMLYKFLIKMLDKFGDGQQRDPKGTQYLRLFTNELITDSYLAIQFETLKPENTNPLLLATLIYLQTLQRHLVSTEVFPRRFLEQILLVLINGSATTRVCSKAAQLYVTMARRQYDEQEIVVHIIETFLKTQHNSRRCASYKQAVSLLQHYLTELSQHFPALHNFDYYIFVLTASNVRDELVLFTAHCIYVLFEFYIKKYEEQELVRQEIHKILRNWPRLIESTSGKTTARAVLYGILGIIDFRVIARHNIELLSELETYCLNNFLTDKTLNEAEFSSLFANVCKSIEATGNKDLLVMTAKALQEQYTEICMQILHQDQDESEESEQSLENFAQCVRRLYALLKENKLDGDQVCHMYEVLAMQLLSPEKISECLALYGYESLALMLSLLQRNRDQLEQVDLHDEIPRLAQQLNDHCARQLCNVYDNLPLVKSMFCAILVLQLGLNRCVPLSLATYDALLHQLSNPLLAQKSRISTLYCSYVQEMHLLFRQLHNRSDSSLPIKRIWKPLLQFKMHSKVPDFISPELCQLVQVLIRRHIETFVHCLATIHLRICNETTSKKRIEVALSSYMQLVDKHASVKEAWLLKLHVFNASLELLIKTLSVHSMEGSARNNRNNLMPLQYLIPLLSSLRLEQIHFINIACLLSKLMSSAFRDQDKKELDKFLTQISAYKYRCEDEDAKELATDELSSDLKSQPPGPLTLWQTEAQRKIF